MTLREFVILLCETDNTKAKSLIDEWQETADPEHLERFLNQSLSMETLLELRNGTSSLFAYRLSKICTEALYDRYQKAHVAFIMEFDEKAGRYGFLVTAKRSCVTVTEAMREGGLIQVTTAGVSLTPKGIEVARQVQKEINGTD